MLQKSMNPVSSASPEFYAALIRVKHQAQAAVPEAYGRIRRAVALVLSGYRAIAPMGPCRCLEHDGPAPEDRCRHDWATVLYTDAVQALRPAHWEADYTHDARDARAAQGDLVAQVASDFAHDRTS